MIDGILGAVLDALVEPVIVVGSDGVVQLTNVAAVQVLGADRDVGRPIADHLARLGAHTPDGAPLPPTLHPIARALAQRQAIIGAELSLDFDGRALTCFVNVMGLGLQFAALGALAYEAARKHGVGREIPTDWLLESEHP